VTFLVRRRTAALALTGALVSALAGCGGDDAPAVATAVTGAPAASASAARDAVAEFVESRRAYVTCLRAEGLKVSDPDARGQFTYDDPAAVKRDPANQAAQEKCKHLLTAIPAELEQDEVPTAEEAANRRAYAKCMRDNGVPDFHDPQADGRWPDPGPDPTFLEAPDEQELAAQYRAGQICGPVAQGGPPGTPNPNDKPQG
jgi:hypothetical protein